MELRRRRPQKLLDHLRIALLRLLPVVEVLLDDDNDGSGTMPWSINSWRSVELTERRVLVRIPRTETAPGRIVGTSSLVEGNSSWTTAALLFSLSVGTSSSGREGMLIKEC